jgi:hypothetical protein
MRETFAILRGTGTLEQIQAVCRSDIAFRTILSLFLTEAGAHGTVNQPLQAIRDLNRGFRLLDLNDAGAQYLRILAAYPAFTSEFFPHSLASSSSSDNDSFRENYMQDLQDDMAEDSDENDDEQQDAAVSGNAADLNQDNGPGEDGGDRNKNRDNAAAAAPDNNVAPAAAN